VNHRFITPASDELRRAAFDYNEKVSGLGLEFLDEIDRAIERILKNPLAWRQISPNHRRCRTKRFPYALVYSIDSDLIIIVSVMHLHRHPDAWKENIRVY